MVFEIHTIRILYIEMGLRDLTYEFLNYLYMGKRGEKVLNDLR